MILHPLWLGRHLKSVINPSFIAKNFVAWSLCIWFWPCGHSWNSADFQPRILGGALYEGF